MTATCTSIVPIPLPADDTDRHHSLHAALSSLGAATASFDAAMDALSANAARHRRRIADLKMRTERFREALRRLDDVAAAGGASGCGGESTDGGGGGGGCRRLLLRCPGTYEGALLGLLLRDVEGGLSEVRGMTTTTTTSSSARDAARRAADDAVRRALSADASADDGMAVPSDAWLDRASTGLEGALELANDMRGVPLVSGEDVRGGGEADYRRALEALVLNASSASSSSAANNNALEGRARGAGDDESVYTTTSQMSSSMSVASGGTRMTAGQRRRWHKQQMSMKASSTSHMMPTALSPHIEIPSRQTNTSAPGRQQSHVGSQPYLCEVFHDSYGIGMEPPRGLVECPGFSPRGTREGGTEFYPPSSHVTDLHVFNTARNSYGPTTMTGGGAAAQSISGPLSGETAPPKRSMDAGDNEKSSGPRDVSPHSVIARKKQPKKQSLSHLVFMADANSTEEKDAPTLDLPETLPDSL
ncbi:hypothetical protein ACHAW5_007751 [Stephanodiscus triporus]|uniref:Mediator of RNA polymerase II transcription subunit 4 n=1 Tax=Stephanodiscus triporus TaxID=2934178 RepID=A0ABD3PH64_9STRA